jgi:predicted O-methyltransferase YrrM
MGFIKYYLISLFGVIYLFLVGFFKKRHRDLIYLIAMHLGFSRKIRSQIETVEFIEISKEKDEISMACLNSVDGNISNYELMVINMLVRQYRPSQIFEIGTFDGRTTLNMAINAPADCHIFTLDLPASMKDEIKYQLAEYETLYVEKTDSGAHFHNHPASGKIEQLFGDSGTFDFTSYYGLCDLVFVDGSHAYDYVKNDTEHSFKLLKKKGGIILWHDCGEWDGVTQYLNEINKQWPGKLIQIKDTSLCIYIAGERAFSLN